MSKLKFPSPLLGIIVSFLQNRKSFDSVNGKSSEKFECSSWCSTRFNSIAIFVQHFYQRLLCAQRLWDCNLHSLGKTKKVKSISRQMWSVSFLHLSIYTERLLDLLHSNKPVALNKHSTFKFTVIPEPQLTYYNKSQRRLEAWALPVSRVLRQIWAVRFLEA